MESSHKLFVIDNAPYTLQEAFEERFRFQIKDGSYPGFCLLRFELYHEADHILIEDRLVVGSRWQRSTGILSDIARTSAQAELGQYAAALTDTFVQFCQQHQIGGIHLILSDLQYHIIDTSPARYARAFQNELARWLAEGRFELVAKP
ncbi:MAG: hypothetical protein AAF206_24820 [Bacteroidota bacterium]